VGSAKRPAASLARTHNGRPGIGIGHVGPGGHELPHKTTTVGVPPELESVFGEAERVVSTFFRELRRMPERGTIEIAGERYILVRAAALSVELFGLVQELYGPGHEAEADEFARNLLFDLAHAIGRSDAHDFHARMGLVDPIARLSAGPVHFAHSGWAFVDISPDSHVEAGDGFCLVYEHPYSFEADAWLRAGRTRDRPACVMNAGYSSGWCQESFGLELVAFELTCRVRGDAACRFLMAPPTRIEEQVARYLAERPTLPNVGQLSMPDFFSRKRAEGEIKRLYEELAQRDRLKSRLFANVSHELRTPLTLILGGAERLAGDSSLTLKARSNVELVTRNAQLLLKHVNDLLEVARLEAAKVELRFAEVDLSQLVRVVASNFEVVAAERRVSFVVQSPERVPCEVDPDAVQRVVANLLSNAFKITPEGGTIRCALQGYAEADGRPWLRLLVADSGPGVPEEQRTRIFERFVTLESGDSEGPRGGTGLGLSIVKELAELHDGRVRVEDAGEGGAQFVVELPLRPSRARPAPLPMTVPSNEYARASAQSLRVPSTPPSTPTAVVGSPADPLVLVVEDNHAMNRFLVDSLSEDHRVVSAFDGVEGLEKALEHQPDIIVTDLMMPRMTGEELVRAARERRELDGVPILVLTARPDADLRVDLLRGGAQDFLMKPFATAELRARLANLVSIKRARETLQAQLASDATDLVDLAAQAARRDRDLTSALAALDVAREQAERASVLKSNLLSMVSHEFLTPLATQRLSLDLIARDRSSTLSPNQAKSIDRIRKASASLHRLVSSLLEHARVEGGRLRLEIGPLDVAALATEVVDELRPAAEARKLALRLLAPPDLPIATTDPRLVRLVLVNLIGNAIKFTERGSVEVVLSHAAEQHSICVRDTGRGIPQAKHSAIFDPFLQLDPAARKNATGVGLGLALVKELVDALRGRIELESEEGVGSAFTIWLPALTAPPSETPPGD